MLSEKMMEDQIAERPSSFLERDLVLVSRQLRIGRYIFDLLFQDRHEGKLIVEIQKGTLDREHTYKILDYYDEYREQHPKEFIELMVVANQIPVERKKRLHAFGVEFREIPESRFIHSTPTDVALVEIAEDSERRQHRVVDTSPIPAVSEFHAETHARRQSKGSSAFVKATRGAIETALAQGLKSERWKPGGQDSLTVVHVPITRWLQEHIDPESRAQIWMEAPERGAGSCKFEIARAQEKRQLREKIAAGIRHEFAKSALPTWISPSTGSTVARCLLSLPGIKQRLRDDTSENAARYATEIAKVVAFLEFLDDGLKSVNLVEYA